ncbi:MAG: hypothetical protein GY749_02545 [Desulfobacteraceae bacterium]|nr:hypothetical protein [Desulfobacteraceae bacterium]
MLKLLSHQLKTIAVFTGMRQDGTAHFSRQSAAFSGAFSPDTLKNRVS